MIFKGLAGALAVAVTTLSAVACRNAPLDSLGPSSSEVSSDSAGQGPGATDAGSAPCSGASGIGEYRFKFCDESAGGGLAFSHSSCIDAFKNCTINRSVNAARPVTCNWTQDGGTEVLLVEESVDGECDPYLGAWPLPPGAIGRDGG